jgi:hypothetical protein
MFKKVLDRVWAFDCEWAPDPVSGRMLYNLPDEMEDREVVGKMWEHAREKPDARAKPDDSAQPYLRTIVCRVVSIVCVERLKQGETVSLRIHSFPNDPKEQSQCAERYIIERFLNGVGKNKPQLVGFNSQSADLKILVQRGLATGVQAKLFCRRPDKQWDGSDYFSRYQDCNVDLMDIAAGWGNKALSLDELATVCGIPGKIGTSGDRVADLWLDGRLQEIVNYNQCDAVTTYLVWLRMAHFAGHFTSEEYVAEQDRVRQELERRIAAGIGDHFREYLVIWDRLRRFRGL